MVNAKYDPSNIDENTETARKLLFQLENRLRDFVISKIGGDRKRIAESFWKDWKSSRKKEEMPPREPQKYDLLYYSTFDQLKKIIVQNENWSQLFQKHFGRSDGIISRLNELDSIRDTIAHNRILSDVDFQSFRILYQQIMRCLPEGRNLILPSSRKEKKVVRTSDPKIIDLVYCPLYAEIDRFLSKKDKFTVFNPSQYHGILSNSKIWLDLIDTNLHEEIEIFYNELGEFNSLVRAAERIIPEIVNQQISDEPGLPYERPQGIYVELETDQGTTTPTLAQILIRKTAPEQYFQTQDILRSIRKITYSLRLLNTTEKIDKHTFTKIFEKCEKEVENNSKITKMRKLRTKLENKGDELKKKLIKLV